MLTKLGDLRDIILIAIASGVVVSLALAGTLDHEAVKNLVSVLIGGILGAVTMAPKPAGA